MASVTQSGTPRPASLLPGKSDHKNVTAEKNGILESVAIGMSAVLFVIQARIFALISSEPHPYERKPKSMRTSDVWDDYLEDICSWHYEWRRCN